MDASPVFTKWTQLRKIGGGSFGYVYKAKREDAIDDTWFAIKVAKKAGEEDKALRLEIDIHSRLTHPDIVRYVNAFDISVCGGSSIVQVPVGKGKCIAMVLELLPGKNVEQLVKVNGQLSEVLIRRLAKQMVSALSYLKEQGIVHNDIKPANILTDSDSNFKLADFGLSNKIENSSNIKKGTPLYMAPEILLQAAGPYFFSYATDMWALGVVLFFVIYSDLPWVETNNLGRFIAEVKKGKLDRWGRDTEPEDLAEFLDGCLVWNPHDRFTPADCLASPFLTNPEISSPAGLTEEARFSSDMAEFGSGSREEFYWWLARKYPKNGGIPLIRFNELYDGIIGGK
uniref:Protein kinase domain-containing protein n=1 Tax=viral metagenome TaxID=1070528 RepID=A0A6C0CFV0_9ZZZZ